MNMNTPTVPDPALDALLCDHNWIFQDDSFDHEFGTEKIHSWQCNKCGAERPTIAEDYCSDYFDSESHDHDDDHSDLSS